MKYVKTESGQQAFKSRSPLFSAKQRTAFIMFDGNKSIEQVMAVATGLGLTQEDVDTMLGHGFLEPVVGEVVMERAPSLKAAAHELETISFQVHSAQDRYRDAKPLATQLTATLGLLGFRLNLAVESADGFDELLALLPKIKEAVGAKACAELERILTH